MMLHRLRRPALQQSASRWISPRALALAVVLLAIISAAGLFSDHAGAAENDHGLVYSVWFAPPLPGEPAVPMTVQDQVHYCGAAEEWSRRIWEVTDGSHLIYQVHFYSGYEAPPPSTEVVWIRSEGTPNGGCSDPEINNRCFSMYDFKKGCTKIYEVHEGELTAHLECLGENQVCSSEDADDARTAICMENGEPVETPLDELGWVMAHENAHSHYNLLDEYVPNSSTAIYNLYHVCVGEPDNQGTDQTSMMAKRMRNHWCDSSTHVTERPVRDKDGDILLDGGGNPFIAHNPNHNPDGAWHDALESYWQKHELEYSGSYDNVPDFPGLPIAHLETGNAVQFCVWHFQGDGQPVNDALVLLDKSGSMNFRHPAFDDGPTALEGAVDSALSFYNSLREGRLGGILAFDTDVTELISYDVKDENKTSLNVNPGGNTNLCRAIREGADAVKAKSPSADFGGGQQILISDGLPTVPGCNTDAEVLLATMDACDGGVDGVGVATNTVALGDADRALLRQVAEACGARTTALLVPTSSLDIDGQIVQRSTPLQVRATLARSARFARAYTEVLNRDAPLAPIRNDSFIVPPGASELTVEWMGDGFEHLFFADIEAIQCNFDALNFMLVRPNGTTVDNGVSPIAGESEYLSKSIRVNAPMPGDWQARIVPDDSFICYPQFAGLHTWGDYDPRVSVVASVRASNIRPQLEVAPTVAPRDTPIRITSSISMVPNARLTGISAVAKVTGEDGQTEAVALFDDGTNGDENAADGTYTGIFNSDHEQRDPGGYRVAVTLQSTKNVSTAVFAGDLGLEIAAAPLPSASHARFEVEDTFVYRDCNFGDGLAGNTCGDHFAIPTGPSGGACSISLPPGHAQSGITIETRGLPLGKRGVQVSGGEGLRVRNIETVSYDPVTKRGVVRFDAEATPQAPDVPRHFRVSFARQSVRTEDCRPPVKPRFEYSAKLVCGAQKSTSNMQLARGFYATTINIRNVSEEAVTFEKEVALTIPPGHQRPGRVLPIGIDTLKPGQALAADCNDVRERVFHGTLPAPFVEGYVVIRSTEQLDVTGVYTTATLNAEGTAEDHSSIHVERAAGRRIHRAKTKQEKPDLTIRDIDMNSLQIDCVKGTCRTRVNVSVENIGAAAAGAFETRVKIDPQQSVFVDSALPGLAPGAAETLTVTFPPGRSCFDPDCTICAVADHDNKVEETDESNNGLCRTKGR